MPQNEFLILMSDSSHPVEAMGLHIAAGLFLLWVISLFWEGLVFKRLTGIRWWASYHRPAPHGSLRS